MKNYNQEQYKLQDIRIKDPQVNDAYSITSLPAIRGVFFNVNQEAYEQTSYLIGGLRHTQRSATPEELPALGHQKISLIRYAQTLHIPHTTHMYCIVLYTLQTKTLLGCFEVKMERSLVQVGSAHTGVVAIICNYHHL